jgi:hypothetical protein
VATFQHAVDVLVPYVDPSAGTASAESSMKRLSAERSLSGGGGRGAGASSLSSYVSGVL